MSAIVDGVVGAAVRDKPWQISIRRSAIRVNSDARCKVLVDDRNKFYSLPRTLHLHEFKDFLSILIKPGRSISRQLRVFRPDS